MEFLDFFKENPQVLSAVIKTAPGIIGAHQANKAKNALEGTDGKPGYLQKLENLERDRQKLVNPFESVSNPFANLQVATKAADMQAEQTDIALANTLDALRQSGGGGATALAQAALKSKQGISASIQQQEANYQRLAAQGEQRAQQLRAQGELTMMGAQERREQAQLDRLQAQIDLAQTQRATAAGDSLSSFTSAAGDLSSLLKPKDNLENENDIPPPPRSKAYS